MHDIIRCTKTHPCPICGKPDWCSYTDDGSITFCMRIASGKQAKNGAYIHYSKPKKLEYIPKCADLKQLKPKISSVYQSELRLGKKENLTAMIKRLFGNEDEKFTVSAIALGGYANDDAIAVPMRDHLGVPVGIRYRFNDGRKSSFYGGSDGMFFDPDVILEKQEYNTVFICEGLSDTIALNALGFASIGRSSCATGQVELQKIFEGRSKELEIVIVADNDDVKENNGRTYLPGKDGAIRLARILSTKHPTKIIYPPAKFKDVRGMVLSGIGTNKVRHMLLQLSELAFYFKS